MKIKTLIILLASFTASQSVLAHVSFVDTKPLQEKRSFKATIAVPHGCKSTATTQVTIQIPEGVIGVKPMPKANWQNTSNQQQYKKTYQQYGNKVEKGVKSITWTGSLPDQEYDEFTFMAYLAEGNSETIYFPVIQKCEQGQFLWTNTSGKPIHGHDNKEQNAPSLKILPKEP